MTIEIENIYIRFEDSNLKFDIGVLIPKIETMSMSKLWEFVERVTDTTVLYKSLTIAKADAFINYGDSHQALENFLDLDRFQRITSLHQAERDSLQRNLRRFIKMTFEESASRFSGHAQQSVNRYILKDQAFSIDTRLQFTLNKKKKLQENPDSKDPDVKLDMVFGGFFKKVARQDRDTPSILERTQRVTITQQVPFLAKQADDSVNSQLKSVNLSKDLSKEIIATSSRSHGINEV